jgi:2-methylcitrate dehydratase PrpD
MAKTELEALGEFVAGLRPASLSRRAVGLAKLAILNILGGIVVSDHPTLNPGRYALLRYADRWGARPRARIIGSDVRTAPELAALVTSGSAMMAHGDDWSWPARTHLSSVVFPAALATAEAEDRSGAELIAAFIAGWEVSARVGAAILPAAGRSPFTSPVHSLATAAVTANLMGHDAQRAAWALSIATDMGTGLLAQAPSQHVVLRTPLGGGLGIYAAGIAAEGVAGKLTVLETFCRVYGDYDRRAIEDGLGERLRFEETGFLPKVFHFSTGTYPTINGIRRHQTAQPVATGDIVAIECATSPVIRAVYGAPPAAARETTHFSLALGIALALTGSPFLFEHVATIPNPDPEVTRLAQLVKLVAAPGLEQHVNLGSLAAEESVTRLTLRDGRMVTIASEPYPSVLDPDHDRRRIEELFLRRVTPRWGRERAERIRAHVADLENLASVRLLVDRL